MLETGCYMCNGYIKIDDEKNIMEIGEDEIEVTSSENENQAMSWAEYVREKYNLDYVDTSKILKALLIGISGPTIDVFETYGLEPDGTEFCNQHILTIATEAKQNKVALPNSIPELAEINFRELDHFVINTN